MEATNRKRKIDLAGPLEGEEQQALSSGQKCCRYRFARSCGFYTMCQMEGAGTGQRRPN